MQSDPDPHLSPWIEPEGCTRHGGPCRYVRLTTWHSGQVINPLFPALRSGPTAGSGAYPKSKFLAAAHKLARILYAIVKHRTPFDPKRLGNPEQSRARKERFLRRQAEGLGFTLTPVEREVS
jgi:hypothetical protein